MFSHYTLGRIGSFIISENRFAFFFVFHTDPHKCKLVPPNFWEKINEIQQQKFQGDTPSVHMFKNIRTEETKKIFLEKFSCLDELLLSQKVTRVYISSL